MKTRRYVAISGLILFPLFLLTQFQNCAPAAVPLNSPTQDKGSDEVRIIDEWNKVEIQFPSREIVVRDEAAEVLISGLCSRLHNGARLQWALVTNDKRSTPILVGESSCARGQFSFQVPNLEAMVCGVPHRLVVEGDWGGVASVDFEKRCQSLASEAISPQCYVEYLPVDGQSCQQVCYRDNKVEFSQALPDEKCSGLAQKLASP